MQESHQHNTSCQHTITSCCLKTEPTPLSENFQKIRKSISKNEFEEVPVSENINLEISEDMLVGDIIEAFPESRIIFEESNWLGLKSPSYQNESIEMFLAGTGISPEEICKNLNQIIKKN